MWSIDAAAAAAAAAATASGGEEDGWVVVSEINRSPRDANASTGAGVGSGWGERATDVRGGTPIFLPRPF